jgi:hypothetical protein
MKIKIVRECSDFLKSSTGIPLVRMLPREGSAMRTVKIRKKKSTTPFDEVFNTVFSYHPNVRQRCVFTNGVHAQSNDPTLEEFFIFPKDGFRFMYSTSVVDSSQQYSETLAYLQESMTDSKALTTIGEILQFDYKSTDLIPALISGCEIIIFGCPSYYAISKDSVKSYSTLFSL